MVTPGDVHSMSFGHVDGTPVATGERCVSVAPDVGWCPHLAGPTRVKGGHTVGNLSEGRTHW